MSKCGGKDFLIVVYGYPSNEVIDEIDKYDIRGCMMPPFTKVRDKKSGELLSCPEPKYSCSNKDCRLEVFKKGLKTKNVQQLHELQREYLGTKKEG